MPSWKKVAISGSSPEFNHITASGTISVKQSHLGGRILLNGNDTTDNFILYDNFDGLDTMKLQSGNVIIQADTNFTLDCAGDIELNADGGDISFKDASTTLGGVNNSGIFSNNHITASGNISASGTSHTFGGDIFLTDTASPTITLTDTTNNYALNIQQANSDASIVFDDHGNQNLIFDSNADNNHMFLDGGTGFTGLGNNSPASKLDITGDLKVSTNITASGDISSSLTSTLSVGTGSIQESLTVGGNIV